MQRRIRRIDDPWYPWQLLDGDRCSGYQTDIVAGDQMSIKVCIFHGSPNEGDMHFFVFQPFEDLKGVCVPYMRPYAGVPEREDADKMRQHAMCESVRSAYPDHSLNAECSHVLNSVPGLLQPNEHLVRVGYDVFSFRGELHSLRASQDELHAEFVLQMLYSFAQGRLGHKEPLGGFCDACCLAERFYN